MSSNTKRLETFREAARAFPCPTCGVEVGNKCLNGSGKERKSVHQGRADLVRPRRDPAQRQAILNSVGFVGDSNAKGFVVYGIRNKATRRFGYVGQTGNFARRVALHAEAAHRGSRTRQSVRWMHEIVSGGGMIEFVLLEYCIDEEHSLAVETKWVQKLTAAGHDLTNRWRIHQEVIAAAKSS